jgi:hypothetical protein
VRILQVKVGEVDSKRLCIDGRSAGGYTTMAALVFKDTFTAGASLYGVLSWNSHPMKVFLIQHNCLSMPCSACMDCTTECFNWTPLLLCFQDVTINVCPVYLCVAN